MPDGFRLALYFFKNCSFIFCIKLFTIDLRSGFQLFIE
jgi:hypothetical protein